jgi:transposase
MITVGIDISKLKFDVYYEVNNKCINKSFRNNQEGFEALLKLMPQNTEITFAMEATGNYGYDLANYMYNHKAIVYVINPAQIKYYAKSLLSRTKTDKADAKLIHNFVVTQQGLHPWKPLNSNQQQLRALIRCIQNLKRDITQFSNRIESEKDTNVISIYQDIIDALKNKVKVIESRIATMLKEDDDLSSKVKLLESIPGVGEYTAWVLLAELPDLSQFRNAKQIAAYAGLNPGVKQSGSSVRSRGSISKTGAANLRVCLYFPAITALRCNANIKAFGSKLSAKGKRPKAVIVAAMHKLLRLIFAILKSGKPFNAA